MVDQHFEFGFGRDPAAAVGFLALCTVVSGVAVGLLGLPNVDSELWILLTALLGTTVVVADYTGRNRGFVTGFAGALVVLYGVLFGLDPFQLTGIPPPTPYQHAGKTLGVALAAASFVTGLGGAIGFVVAAIGDDGPAEGGHYGTLGRAVAAPLPNGATPGVVLVALLVVSSAGGLALAAPHVGAQLPCGEAPHPSRVDLSESGGSLHVEYEQPCTVPAGAIVVAVGDERRTWAQRDAQLSPDDSLVRGDALAVSLPETGWVDVRYEPRDGSGAATVVRWNVTEGCSTSGQVVCPSQ